jgi:hypothetical protein
LAEAAGEVEVEAFTRTASMVSPVTLLRVTPSAVIGLAADAWLTMAAVAQVVAKTDTAAPTNLRQQASTLTISLLPNISRA